MQETTYGCQKCNINQILIIDGDVNIRESLHIQVSIWMNAILKHVEYH